MPTELCKAQARRIALVAQGFRDPRHTTPTMRTFARTLARTGVLQVDSVNVLQRAHYMPLFSRMGPYDTDMLKRAAEQKPRRVVEYWAHVQAFMPVELWPVMRPRMEFFRDSPRWGAWVKTNLGNVDRVLDQVREGWGLDGALPRRRRSAQEGRLGLELVGDPQGARLPLPGGRPRDRRSQLAVRAGLRRARARAARRGPGGSRSPSAFEATKELIRRAARSHGVGTARCLTDYYRLQTQRGEGLGGARRAIDELVEDGELLPVTVEGWKRPAYLHRDAKLPRKVDARALLSPFDPVVWERERTEHIFDFHYRIEIYVPEPKRQFGYYVLPFLLGDQIVGRVDLKADRKAGTLLVKAAYAEPGAPPEAAEELGAELRDLAGWLGLDDIVVHDKGGLAAALGATIAG